MSEIRTTELMEKIWAREKEPIGEFGNLWNNDLVAYNGASNAVDTVSNPNISIMVNSYSDEANTTPANVTLNFEISPDGVHWTFCSQITQDLPQGGGSESHIFPTVGGRYVRLVRDDTITDDDLYLVASLQAKP